MQTYLAPILAVALGALGLTACSETEGDTTVPPPVRGLKVFEVSESTSSISRRYPSLVEPADESRLSFEIAGQLQDVTLEEGQTVQAGQTLMRLDDTSLELELQEARAALQQDTATLENARADFDRKSELLTGGNVTRAAYDKSETDFRTAQTQQIQASRRFDIARERLDKTVLRAPFSGVIANVEAKSFTNINPGETVVTLFSQNAFEVRLNVPALVINLLSVGDMATVVITDLGGATAAGRIQEISTRASQISAFPVVIALTEAVSGLRAGMAAEAIVSITLQDEAGGYLVPLSVMDFERSAALRAEKKLSSRPDSASTGSVFLFDPETETVRAREVTVLGVRDNMLIVSEGLKPGDLIASAGVSFLYDGQKVRRLNPVPAR